MSEQTELVQTGQSLKKTKHKGYCGPRPIKNMDISDPKYAYIINKCKPLQPGEDPYKYRLRLYKRLYWRENKDGFKRARMGQMITIKIPADKLDQMYLGSIILS